MIDRDETIRELTLMLMYLTSWEEAPTTGLRRKLIPVPPEEMFRRCWKGYDHAVLGKLEAQGLIADHRSRAPVFLTDGGAKLAEELLQQYGIVVENGGTIENTGILK